MHGKTRAKGSEKLGDKLFSPWRAQECQWSRTNNNNFSREGCASLPDTITSSTMEDLPINNTAKLFDDAGAATTRT